MDTRRHSHFIPAVLHLTLSFVLMCADAAPTFTLYKSKMEPRCSHDLEETLCWTVQFHRPLHTPVSDPAPKQNHSSNFPSLTFVNSPLSEKRIPQQYYNTSLPSESYLKFSPSEEIVLQHNHTNGETSPSSLLLSSFESSSFSPETISVVTVNVYDKMASHLAEETGLTLLGRVGEFEDHFRFCHHGTAQGVKQSTVFQDYHRAHSDLLRTDGQTFVEVKKRIESALQDHHDVAWFSMETVHQRHKRAVSFNDPAFDHQWHLVNHMEMGMDINVTGVWERGFTGRGVTVAVVDDGLEWDNPDLHSNYNIGGSWDLNNNDPDPMPDASKVSNHHGTRCAGEIAAVANNSVCGVGVAYGSKVSGIRLLDGPMTDSLEAEAFNKKFDINAIYSCSWGPDDDGKTVDGPHLLAAKAMKYGVDFGRHGYGSIFVVASGNGGSKQDNCNYDGYANSIYTVTIGAVDESGGMPYYAEECASMLGVTFSSGIANNRDIVTTDWRYKGGTGCTDQHTGTSASAPLAAGMIALVLDARPCLTWRDVQYIIIMTAVKIDVDLAHWQKNGAGLDHSHKHGFGLLKAWRMVNAARVWRPVPWMSSFSHEDSAGWEIPRGHSKHLTVTHTVTQNDIAGYSLLMLEYIQVTVTLSHPVRGKLSIELHCPSGTVSVIGAPRPNDNSTEGFSDWTFTTVRCWGEAPTGEWTLQISDLVSPDSALSMGRLIKWRLTLFGTPMTTAEFQKRRREVEQAMRGQYLSGNYTPPCDPPPVTTPPYIPLSEKTLKILFLASAFCVVFAIYETFEYMFCYGEEKRQQQAEQARMAQQSSSDDYHHDEDAPETERLLSRQDSSASGDPLRTEFGDAVHDEEEDDMFLLNDGIAAGVRQANDSVKETGACAFPRDNIRLSVFNRTASGASSTADSLAPRDSNLRPASHALAANNENHNSQRNNPGLLNGAYPSQTSTFQFNPIVHASTGTVSSTSGSRLQGVNSDKPAVNGKKSESRANAKSILPEMWRALTQEKDDSDSGRSEDDVFCRNSTSSKSPLLQNGANGVDR